MRSDGTTDSGVTTGSAARPSEPAILVAQAAVPGAAPQPFPLPAANQITRLQPLPAGGGIEGRAYSLPDGAAFDRIRVVEIDGRLVLALVQPDGSVIVLEGTAPVTGSTTEFEVPNLMVGEVEVPREALQARISQQRHRPRRGRRRRSQLGLQRGRTLPGHRAGTSDRGSAPADRTDARCARAARRRA